MAPRRTSSGSCCRPLPKGVINPAASIAPRRRSVSCAAAARLTSGGSGQSYASVRKSPHEARFNSSPDRSPDAISGGSKACSCSASGQRRITTPGRRRPARPARCTAEAWLIRSVTMRLIPREASHMRRLRSPLSITQVMPSMVRLVSATFVATTMRVLPGAGGLSARCCSAGVCRPYKGSTSMSLSLWHC